MKREICKCCGEINRVGFSVSDDIWIEAVPEIYRETALCLNCFTRFADESLIEWDKRIVFYPVSFKAFIEQL